ncbi:MAG: hypothetical protein J6B02_02475 [Selenomonadales bacterium]|nr:hypothetical protein [Selenomonadales bacterium]
MDDIFGNIKSADNLWQNPFDIWKNTGISAPSAPQAENKPAFDLRQAVKNLADSLKERWDSDITKSTQNHFLQNREANSSSSTASPYKDSYIAVTVKERRDAEITRLEQLQPQPYSHEEAVYIANTQVEGWLVEAIGKELVKSMLSKTMNELKIPTQAQHYIIATWETFVNDQKRKYQSKIV